MLAFLPISFYAGLPFGPCKGKSSGGMGRMEGLGQAGLGLDEGH